ncbi:mannose-1-phosphate guanylyltransferase/mannose-6-phosphate isomerase [Woodsholea maritima]|uniref:mannose-1-phosphate guanylyltransferase/mannose-6-phosphate isomerase n=1 Tax=Woodsholea maritima TaxID=240237 RepID=UPI000362CAB5|nr:mannose-1-phosphate guanylyltransferase/mannose-6-phosphate isomerase [Woodsholea maritima]
MIIPVLLAGGSGTRLWPLSRQSYPKQFSPLLGKNSLFQETAKRLKTTDTLNFAPPLTLTNSDFRFIVAQQLTEVRIDPGPIFIEPVGKNTAPAILAAALYGFQSNPEAVLLVCPSDHAIPDHEAFHQAVSHGLKAIEKGQMVTFGIRPSYPETGYGYLELSHKPDGQDFIPLKQFVEKPDIARAHTMVEAGTFLWNAGIFLFKASDMIEAFERYAPAMIDTVRTALDKGQADLGFLRLDPSAWGQLDDISIDYAIMEKADNLSVVPFDKDWSDLGDWNAVWRESPKDDVHNALGEHAFAIDCEHSLLRSENEDQVIVGIGLDHIAAIAMPDAVLVADMRKSQDVKKAVALLNHHSIRQATSFPKDHRPWGWFESLVIGERFQVKRIHVHPGASLSLQSHFHRSEHWIVVEGTARVTVDDKVQLLSENQSVYVPLGSVHRMENPGKVPMVLIEVQTGTYVGEDDIVRYEDKYARN